MRLAKLVAALAGALMLVGCGIKGSLYLPEIPPDPATASPPALTDYPRSGT